MPPTKRILLLRAEADLTATKRSSASDSYSDAIQNEFFGDFEVVQVPVLKFDFINLDLLSQKLSGNFDGIVMTSPRSVEAVAQAWGADEGSDSICSKWTEEKRCYVVGEMTALKVKEMLGWKSSNVIGSEAGNAASLAVIIGENEKPGSKLLFPCGNLKRSELEDGLKRDNIELEAVVCYETKPREDFHKILANDNDGNFFDFVVFFSPSGVKSAFKALLNTCPGSKVIAIGPTTAESLKEKGCPDVLIARKPNALGIVQIMKENMN